MPCTLRLLPPFERRLKKLLKKYPNSATAISKEIKALAQKPESGVVYPGFNPFQVRKLRIGLRAYRLSSARGLRLIFLYLPEKQLVAPLVIYKKGGVASEQQVQKLILTSLVELQAEL